MLSPLTCSANEQHWHFGVVDYPLGNAAKQPARRSGTSVGRHGDTIHIQFLGDPQDHLSDRSHAQSSGSLESCRLKLTLDFGDVFFAPFFLLRDGALCETRIRERKIYGRI